MADISTTVSNFDGASSDSSMSTNDAFFATLLNKTQVEHEDCHSQSRAMMDFDSAIISIGRSSTVKYSINNNNNNNNSHCDFFHDKYDETYRDDQQQINIVDQMIIQPHLPLAILPKHFKSKVNSNDYQSYRSTNIKRNNCHQHYKRKYYSKENNQYHQSIVSRYYIPKQRTRSQSQQKNRNQEDVCVRTGLPPLVEGPVYANLICHIPKLRWNPKHHGLSRYVTVKVTWWGEDETSALFKPQVSGAAPLPSHQPSSTGKYYIRSELKQFSRYLTDAAELVLKVHDSESNRMIGIAKVQNLSLLTINNPIKGYQSIFTNKGEKLGEIFIALRIVLPGTYDSNENLAAISFTSDASNPPSRRNSIGANDYNQNDQLNRAYNGEHVTSVHTNDSTVKQQRFDSTVPFKTYETNSKHIQPGMQTSTEQPAGNLVEALIERANHLRDDMMRSSLQKTTMNDQEIHPMNRSSFNNNNSEIPSTRYDNKPIDMLDDNVDLLLDNEHICDMLGIKPSVNSMGDLNNSNDSILTDLDGLEHEQSLLDELLYGDDGKRDTATTTTTTTTTNNNNNHKRRTKPNNKLHPYGKPPTGRSPSPNTPRVSGLLNRSRSTRSRSLAQSSDSDTASRVSFDLPSSDLDDSGNESHDDDSLGAERIHLLSFVRTARVRIDQLRLNILNNDRESPSHSSFGRTNKSKRATTYFIEYQFPVIANSRDGPKNEATQVMKIASKRFEANNDISFSHISTYPCLLNEPILKNWWRSLLIFKVYSRMSGSTAPEQIGFAVLPLRHILKADSLHLEQNLNVIDRTQMNQQKIPNKISKKFSIGHLHVLIELDSDATNFKLELDRIRLIEQNKPKKQRTGKIKKFKKKSKQIIINPNNDLQLPKAFSSEGFMAHESTSDLNDGFVVQVFLSISEARNILQISNNNLSRNPYFVCRAFWNEEPITSIVCWGSLSPKFNFEQKIPILLTKSALEKMHNNFIIIEVWDKKISGPADIIIGIIKISLEQFYTSFKDRQISQVLLRGQYPVVGVDSWLPIIDPFTTINKSHGDLQILLAMGTSDQITAIQIAHASKESSSPSICQKSPTNPNNNDHATLAEHCFEVLIESINGLRAFESMVWGESDCFIQYLFPVQQEQSVNVNSIKPFEFRQIRTPTTLCTSDPTFHDTNKFRYILAPTDVLHKYFYSACQSPSTIETCIPFEVWSRFYYPNVRDQLLAKAKLPAAKLCGMTTMMNPDRDNKSTQSFRIPLEIVREEPKREQSRHTLPVTYGGDLLVTVTYNKNIIQKNERQTLTDRLANKNSQVCISVGIIRACGLKHATLSQSRHDARLNYPSQVGVNTYAKLSLSFLSETESRATRTIARSFVPEFNHSIDFPVPLIWNDNRTHTISLAEILEHGELKIDVYHQMSGTTDATQEIDKRPLDIHLCYCTISLKDLISRHTGIKGWYPLASANRVRTSAVASDPSEHCVGGLELSVRFGQQDDRSRIIESAKTLGWLDNDYIDEENFLDDQKDLGCLITMAIDRIQFPIQLATRPGKDRIDDRTSVFVQYRLYDKMPIISKRKKPIVDRHNVICELKFSKDHLFLCSAPFLWYLREEKLEVQIWTSDNDSYDYSPSVSSTDKLIGSIYVDLNSLCDRKRKTHRLNAILPMFKHGAKDLGGAFAQVHVTIDKSKDFNELRSRDDIDASNDRELDIYVDRHHSNITSHDHALRTITNNVFSVSKNAHVPPNPYVSYSTADTHHLCRTQILKSTCKPIWNHQQAVKLSVEHLFNEKKTFILKVWHKVNADIETVPEKSGDTVLGFVSIDLSALLSGLQQISGWYNITDTIRNIQGQLKISIVPQEDLLELKRFKYKSNENETTTISHRSTSTISGNTSSRFSNDLSARTSTGFSTTFNPSMIDDDNSNNNKKSFLMNNLQRQLGELDVITERLKARLHSGSDTASKDKQPPSTMITNRCQSVPPPPLIVSPLSLPLNTNSARSDIDTTRSTTTTIQTDLLEHFPESLSGRPLMSNGLNVSDVLSSHNDKLRRAQELMTRANQLLETSKEFFNKASAPAATSLLTTVEKRLSPPTSPPSRSLSTKVEATNSSPPLPALPNFISTNEFQIAEGSPHTAFKITEHMTESHEEQHQNDSVASSDEEDNNHDQINPSYDLPPTNHRAITPATVTQSLPPPILDVDETSTHREEQNGIGIEQSCPSNKTMPFPIDSQEMNSERLNDNLSPKSDVRRNIFSTESTNDNQQQPLPREISSSWTNQHKTSPSIERQSLSSSSSSSSSRSTSPERPTQIQESFTSDTSVIGKNWLEQQRKHDANAHKVLPSTLNDHSNTKQLPSRSPHLAFIDRGLPNSFQNMRELDESLKHVSRVVSTTNISSATTTSSRSSSSNDVMKTIYERIRAKPTRELLPGKSPVGNGLLQSSNSTAENMARIEKIQKTKPTTIPSSN
ncbi:unnamed protein product [Rotaria socialis]